MPTSAAFGLCATEAPSATNVVDSTMAGITMMLKAHLVVASNNKRKLTCLGHTATGLLRWRVSGSCAHSSHVPVQCRVGEGEATTEDVQCRVGEGEGITNSIPH